MTDLQALLDQIGRLDQEATKGPWLSKGVEPDHGLMEGITVYQEGEPGAIAYVQPSDDDAEFIALARTALPQLAEAVYQVLSLLEVVEKSDKYAYEFGGSKSPSLVTTNEVRQAIHEAFENGK